MLNVHSIETFGAHEGPGLRLVIFLQGCGYKCLYCHNPDTIQIKQNTLISGADILKRLEDGKPYYHPKGGLTFSGGEPTLQAAKILPVFKEAKARGFNTCLDSNGEVFTDKTKALYEYTDLVLLDIKQINNEKHKILTGQQNKKALKTAAYLRDIGVKVWLRYVLVPGYSDNKADIEQWCQHFTDYANIEKAEILPYHALGEHKYENLNMEYQLKGVQPPTDEKLAETEQIFKQYFNQVVVR